jgi:hypothetical protein
MYRGRNFGSSVWYETKMCIDAVIFTVVSILAGCFSIYLLDKFLGIVGVLILIIPTFLVTFALCFGLCYSIYFCLIVPEQSVKGGERNAENSPA